MTSKQDYSDQWPHEVSRTEGSRTYFAPVEAVVEVIWDSDKGVGFKFTEDDTPAQTKAGKRVKGVIWNLDGLNPGIKEHDTVNVTLTTNQGTSRTFYDVSNIAVVERPVATPESTESAREAPRAPRHPADTKDRLIAAQAVIKSALEGGLATLPLAMKDRLIDEGYAKDVYDRVWNAALTLMDWGMEAIADFSPEDSPLVRAAQEMGGEIVSEEELPNG